MRAVVCSGYGPPDRLEIREVDQPRPGDGEVLVRVQATTVNRTDAATMRGKPRFARIATGLIRPRQSVMGTEFAGIVEDTGAGVTEFSVGDGVFGFHAGAQAEYLTIGDHRVQLPFPTDTRAHVRLVRELLASSELRPVVDRTDTLDNIVDAYHYVETEQKLGTVVIDVT